MFNLSVDGAKNPSEIDEHADDEIVLGSSTLLAGSAVTWLHRQ